MFFDTFTTTQLIVENYQEGDILYSHVSIKR